jgi:LAO/AO transport system kinase
MPKHLNPNRKNNRRKELDTKAYIDGILKRDRSILSRAITLIESKKSESREQAQEIIEACLPYSGKSFRIGITGVPGVGKSTLIESFGIKIIDNGHRLAVLAIDPSSEKSRGSILGDKTRMEKLSTNENAFIRPSPASDALGGVERKTRESIILCEAAGYDYILVETVGVGQSEIAVHSMVDFFLLMLLPGAGDELQGIKRGIVEMADMIVINKAEGNKLNAAKRAKIEYQNALHLYPPNENNWNVLVELCSALNGEGIDTIIKILRNFRQTMIASNNFEKNRQHQNQYWLLESLNESLQRDFQSHPQIAKLIQSYKTKVASGILSPFKASEELIKIYKK